MVSVQDEALVEVPLQDEDSIEFRMFRAYAQRTLPNSKFSHLMSRSSVKKKDGVASNGEGPAAGDCQSPSPKKEKKKGVLRRITPKCLRPPKEKRKPKAPASESPEDARLRLLAQRVEDLVQKLEKEDEESVEFRGLKRQDSVQHDGDAEDAVIEDIVLYLRAAGDKANAQVFQEQNFLRRLQSLWSYSFFQRLTESYLAHMAPSSEAAQQSSRIALCVHATTKLAALDNHPMNRMFGFGARYLKENYSQWIKEQGGWEKVMGIPDIQDEAESEED